MNEKELMTEWVSSQRAKYKIIDSWQDIPPDEKAILKHHATTPLYHYIREANERGLLKLSQENQGGTGGRESGGDVTAGGSAETRHTRNRSGTKTAQYDRDVTAAANPAPSSNASVGELPACAKCHKPFTPRFAGATLCFDCWKADHPTKRR